MNLLKKIKLSGRYGKGLYIISMLITLSESAVALFIPQLVFTLIILKFFSMPILMYLYHSFRKELTIYFYLNLGISKVEFYTIPPATEAVFFAFCIITSSSIGYAIG